VTSSTLSVTPRVIAPVSIFVAFAFAYFLSALLRAVTATLAPVFSAELALSGADLGLLAGGYFLGFACAQLPLGEALDRFGPRRVELGLLVLACVGCMAFAAARSLPELVAARVLIGVGVSACLMAPLTCFRLRFSSSAQLRANSWMLMTGSLGMVASTAPTQAMLELTSWRELFWLTAALLGAALLLIWWVVPQDEAPAARGARGDGSLLQVLRHPLFWRMAPLGFFGYGGLIAVQALWAGPWLTEVVGLKPESAAAGLLVINTCMLAAFFAWGWIAPHLARDMAQTLRLVRWGGPASLAMLGAVVWLGEGATAGHWAAWCVASTVISLSQPALALAFPSTLAGRALSAYNLVIFLGVFVLQWTIGISIDYLRGEQQMSPLAAYRTTFAGLLLCCAAAYLWFAAGRAPVVADNLTSAESS